MAALVHPSAFQLPAASVCGAHSRVSGGTGSWRGCSGRVGGGGVGGVFGVGVKLRGGCCGELFAEGVGVGFLLRRDVVGGGRVGGKRKEVALVVQGNVKSRVGANGAVFDDVPHITDWLPDLPTYSNPLKFNPAYSAVKQYFVEDDDVVAKDIVVNLQSAGAGLHFRRAGPRDKIYFRPKEVKACIVTCGGLCPGLNTVIREIVCGLWYQYGVHEILGIDGGYRGFYARNTLSLDPKVVNDIHKRGGTILGTSRGGHNTMKIVDSIEDRGINQVYIIGGDGTHKGAEAIHEEIVKRGLKVVVAGIPKTIDNDIDIIDKSFGFDTAVEEAQRAINAAHVEAESTANGVGVVKLMGRYSGYIAMYATLASRDVVSTSTTPWMPNHLLFHYTSDKDDQVGLSIYVKRYHSSVAVGNGVVGEKDCCLIPEVPFFMEGDDGLYEFVYRRLRENGHMVLVVAEGSGQELIAESLGSLDKLSDASGNRLLLDVGLWLCQRLKELMSVMNKEDFPAVHLVVGNYNDLFFKSVPLPSGTSMEQDHFLEVHKESITLKYIDPTYMIRAVPSIASDNVYCTLLAHSAIHGAMAGFCGFTGGPVNNRHCYIPISRAVEQQRHVNTSDRMWARLLSSTHQPSFLRYERVMEEQRAKNAENKAIDLENHLSGLTASHSLPLAPQSHLKRSSNGSSPRSSSGKEHSASQVEDETATRSENAHTQNTPKQPLETTPTPGDPTGIQDQSPQI